ncbi:MAG: hypothetical protein V5A64_00290 [Candidatus Thermoplasmatota archaeon]
MKKAEKELTEGSEYKITSLGGRNKTIETQGIFRGFISIGIDENAVLMELDENHDELSGKKRIIPLHVILAIDILKAKENLEEDDDKGVSHYVG